MVAQSSSSIKNARTIKNESSRAMLSIFFAKSRMGWKETVVSEHANADGKPFIFEVSKTDAKL
jgi:hypothetical protein